MYGIIICLHENHKHQPNVGKCTIHGLYMDYKDPYEPIRISWFMSLDDPPLVRVYGILVNWYTLTDCKMPIQR